MVIRQYSRSISTEKIGKAREIGTGKRAQIVWKLRFAALYFAAGIG